MPVDTRGLVIAEGADGDVYAFRAATGRVVWRRLVDVLDCCSPVKLPLLLSHGLVYVIGWAPSDAVGNSFLWVSALHARTGDLAWRRRLPGAPQIAPTLSAGRLLVDADTPAWPELDAVSGRTLSTAPVQLFGAAIAARGGLLYGKTHPAEEVWNVARASILTGTPAWETQASYNFPGVAVTDRLVVAGSGQAFDRRTGALRWDASFASICEDCLEGSLPTIAGGAVFLGGWRIVQQTTFVSHLWAFSLATGRPLWHSTGVDDCSTACPPVVAGDTVYHLDGSHLVAYRPAG